MTSTGKRDKFGREISIGDRVVYPVRRRSDTYLNDAVITGATDDYMTATKQGGVQVKLRVPERCAIVEV